MDVSPKTVREVEFRTRARGYHPEDVDNFLEQLASGLEVLQDRLRQSMERVQKAEAAVAEAGSSDETIRKTLVLAQRTADLAVQEAREQAGRIIAGAEQQAQDRLADAEEQARHLLDEAASETKAELARLEEARCSAQQEVDALERWLEEHKSHLHASLAEAMAAVERAGILWPAPSTSPIEIPESTAPSILAESQHGSSYEDLEAPPRSEGPDTMLWRPDDDFGNGSLDTRGVGESERPRGQRGAVGGDEQALDDFFEGSDDLVDDRRFGGRLRRRR